tara:strand:+ start:3105 stop:4124 length:1020 start_codon:yes stop_codon:yes gene_type:complete
MRSLVASLAVLLLFANDISAQRRGGDIKPGPWTKSKTPDGWVRHRTRNYQIQSQCGEEKAERLGAHMEVAHMEVMNKVYRLMFRPGKDGAKRQVIKLFKDREAYLQYGAPPSSAAYYSRGEREMVCYDTGKWSDEQQADGPTTGGKPSAAARRRLERLSNLMKMDLLGCAAHEGWHQYFSWYTVSLTAPLPSWINEGMGDYFYTAAPKEVSGRKVPAQLGRLNDGRLMVLKAAVRAGRYIEVEKLITMSKNAFYANGSVCYAEGWAFCQFLLHSGNKKYAKIIPNFVKYVKNDSNYEDVRQRAFKRIDMVKLNTEFMAWIDKLEIPGAEQADEGSEGEI